MSSIKFESYHGFGDQINMRPFVLEALKKYNHVFVVTSFPELLYHGTDVKCLPPKTELKTQKEWTQESKQYYSEPFPKYDKVMKLNYSQNIIHHKTPILHSFQQQFPIEGRGDFTLPVNPEWIDKAKSILGKVPKKKKLCVLKLPTLRTEWNNVGRNAKMEHFAKLIERYGKEYYFVSVADTRDGKEWFTEYLPKGINKEFHKAEFGLDAYIGLFKIADMVIGTPSNIIPLCLAIGTPLYCVYGGDAPSELLASDPADLSRYGYAQPTPFSFTVGQRSCDCYKDISEDVLFGRFEELRARLQGKTYDAGQNAQGNVKNSAKQADNTPKQRKKLLVSRLRHWRCDILQQNPHIAEEFDIISIDHEFLCTYQDCKIEASYEYKGDWCDQVRKIIKKHGITHAIIAQKLNPQADSTWKACQEMGVKSLWAEAFFDNKLILDSTGLQYTCPNDIYLFAKEHKSTLIDLPKATRQPQPSEKKNIVQIMRKYNLPDRPNLVFMGQVTHDMSLVQSINVGVKSYEDFVRKVIEGNPNTNILFKVHPQSFPAKHRYLKDYDNVTIIDESLETLFACFDNFVTYSSTTAFEGLLKGKKFAIGGHTLCSDDRLTIQIRTDLKFGNLYQRLESFKIDEAYREKHCSFITKKYAVDMSKKEFADKILQIKEGFYYG